MTILNRIKKFFYKNILRRTYYREGKCLGCGQCCKQIYVRHAKNVVQTEEEFQRLQKLHPFYTYLKVTGKDEIGLIFECQNLDKETHLCKIHKKRPGICRRYPQEAIFMMGGELAQNCGYKFIPIESFDEVLKNVSKGSK